ncbi:BCAM0308 family protein [Azospirillum sp. ST 5-10]|uniref:BCAM0308 family protein n=1 Tax=unclassified Azospirillum TaxID=2630922 RepID=UPI003F4A5BA6
MTATPLHGVSEEPHGHRPTRQKTHDPYALRASPDDPMRCTECGALFLEGRWRWGLLYIDATQGVCPACRRAADHAPAGTLVLSGRYVEAHKDEILFTLRHNEGLERQEHPMRRIMDIEERNGALVVTTTDIHMPARLGKALDETHHGALDIRPADGQYLVIVHWRCDA